MSRPLSAFKKSRSFIPNLSPSLHNSFYNVKTYILTQKPPFHTHAPVESKTLIFMILQQVTKYIRTSFRTFNVHILSLLLLLLYWHTFPSQLCPPAALPEAQEQHSEVLKLVHFPTAITGWHWASRAGGGGGVCEDVAVLSIARERGVLQNN